MFSRGIDMRKWLEMSFEKKEVILGIFFLNFFISNKQIYNESCQLLLRILFFGFISFGAQ